VKRLSDTLTYRGIASEAVFTVPSVVGAFGPACYPYLRSLWRLLGPLQVYADIVIRQTLDRKSREIRETFLLYAFIHYKSTDVEETINN